MDWQEQKKQAAQRKKQERLYEQTEDRIAVLEDEISALDEELAHPEYACDAGKLTELTKEREKKEAALTDAMEQWEQLAEDLEL